MSEPLMEQFKSLEKQVEANKVEKVRLEERIKGLKEEKVKLVAELEKAGVKEEDLAATIKKLETEITEELEKCKQALA